MKPLFYKELLALRPYLWAMVVLAAVLMASDLVSESLLNGPAQALVHDMDGWLVLSGTLVFAFAHASIAPEVRLGHVQFLDALPITRKHVYAAKVGAGLCVLTIILLISGALKLIAIWGAIDQNTGPVGPVLLTLFIHQAAGLVAFYGMGVLLSWLGGLGWALLLLGYTVLFVAAESSAALRPLSLFHGYGTVRFEQGRAIAVLWPAQAWFVFGLATTFISGLIFVGPGDDLLKGSSRLLPKARRGLIVVIAGLICVLGLLSLVGLLGPVGRRLTQQAGLVHRGNFNILIASQARVSAQPLIDQIEDIDTQVRAVMQEEETLTLDIELMGGGRYHAGQYTGGKIRMSLQGDPVHTLAHELAHAYAHRIVGPPLLRHHAHLRFFNEGLAMWVADTAVGTSTSSDAFRAWAGAIWELDHHHFDALTEDARRAREYDPFEPYPLGLVFVEALVQTHGRDVLKTILGQIRILPDDKYTGRTIWYRIARASGIDLQSVLRNYEILLTGYAERWPSNAAPRYATAMKVNGELVLFVGRHAQPGLICRFRSRQDARPADLQERPVRNGVCNVAVYDAAKNTIGFQIGQKVHGGWVAYGPWTETGVPAP